MLFRDDQKATPFNASRYTDHRQEEPKSRDERIKNNVDSAINNLDHSSHSIKETYKRIMGRNRPAEEEHADFDQDGSGNVSPMERQSPRANYIADDNNNR